MKSFYYDSINSETKCLMKKLFKERKDFMYNLTKEEKREFCELIIKYELDEETSNEQITYAFEMLSRKAFKQQGILADMKRINMKKTSSFNNFKELLFSEHVITKRIFLITEFFEELIVCLVESMEPLINTLLEDCIEHVKFDDEGNEDPDFEYDLCKEA